MNDYNIRHLFLIYYVIVQKTMSPRKSEEGTMIKFCQKQSFADVLQNSVFKNFANFTGKTCVGVCS